MRKTFERILVVFAACALALAVGCGDDAASEDTGGAGAGGAAGAAGAAVQWVWLVQPEAVARLELAAKQVLAEKRRWR